MEKFPRGGHVGGTHQQGLRVKEGFVGWECVWHCDFGGQSGDVGRA